MEYKSIYATASKAIDNAKRMLYRTMLPSIWSELGAGWHEQWRGSPNCGLYASCQGLQVIRETEKNIDTYSNIYSKVYINNLLILFDETISTDNNLKRTLQRGKALGSTYKLAFFLIASNSTDSDNEIVQNIVNRLYGLMDIDGLFFCSDRTRTKSALATSLAYISLYNYKDADAMEQTQYFFINTIKKCRSKKDISRLIFSLWAISCTDPNCIEKSIIEEAITFIFSCIGNNSTIYTDKYVLENGIRDGYSCDIYYIYLQSILRFVCARRINYQDNVRMIIESIMNFSISIKENGILKKDADGDISDTLFWENYYVLECLIQFVECCNHIPELLEEKYMIINPKYFYETEFAVESKKVAVIMPFSKPWSNDVYHTFCNALPDFKIWRSLEVCADDAIMQSVWNHINSCEFVIADCTDKNPNVFYELGIAHTLGKPVFMCAQDISDIPFDINYIRSFLYTNSAEGLNNLENNLRVFARKFADINT